QIFAPNTTTLSTGTWYYTAATYHASTSAGNHHFMVNSTDASNNLNTSANTISNTTPGGNTSIGRRTGGPDEFWNGKLDEVRVASVARSTDWLTTEYNNQSSPGTFETFGTEAPETAPAAPTLINPINNPGLSTALSANFEKGTNGNNVLAADAGDATAWTANPSLQTGATLTYDSSLAAKGSLAAK